MDKKIIVGIDEVGRGSLAGPVSIGIVVIPALYDISYNFGALKIADSKQMTEKARERAHARASELRDANDIQFGVFSEPAEVIDRKGIVYALNECIRKGLEELIKDPSDVHVYLDGSLKAPKGYEYESLIRGDSLIPAISIASIVAKVERDRYMTTSAHEAHPEYGFDTHKGYGTASHIAAIHRYGLSPLHRTSFTRSIVIASTHV